MPSSRSSIELNWELGRHGAREEPPSAWIPAVVPGAVQLDWARAHGLPDFRVGRNVEQWDGLEDFFWTYRARVDALPARESAQRLFLLIEGVDYAAEISLDGHPVGTIEGLQSGLEVDVTDRMRPGSEITVRISPAPKSQPSPRDRSQANRSCKPAVSYGWDFHPRLIPLGLWKPVRLEVRSAVHFARPPELRYRLNDDCDRATGEWCAVLSQRAAPGTLLRWSCLAPDGRPVLGGELALDARSPTTCRIPVTLERPILWWPHDQGAPALYRILAELASADGRVLDRVEARMGFRRVRLVMAPEQWKTPGPSDFPKSRSLPPITLEVNGRALFVKGANWVCPEVFPGTVTAERYAEQLTLARASNLSLLRVWGGAPAPGDVFYEQCDELGLMVWQEFPLACNRYPDDDAYLAVLDHESRALIARCRAHASLVLWCGGNELFNSWSGMTDQSLALRLLNRNCFDLDPGRPFIATAPLEGMAHGHYLFHDPMTGLECWQLFQQSRGTAYTEFGCGAPPSAEALRRIIPVEELWPPRPGSTWELHHAFGAWMQTSHLYPEVIERYFGPSGSLEELVAGGQLLQSAGLQGLAEEARRQKPAASMALVWCFNEPWPAAANTSLVAWPCDSKPALQAVAAAFRPTLASARVRKFSWRPGENFGFELWLLHDSPANGPAVTVAAWIELDGRRHEFADWRTTELVPNTNQPGPGLELKLPEFAGSRFTLHVEVRERPEWSSRYTFVKARDGSASVEAPVVVPQGAMNF